MPAFRCDRCHTLTQLPPLALCSYGRRYSASRAVGQHHLQKSWKCALLLIRRLENRILGTLRSLLSSLQSKVANICTDATRQFGKRGQLAASSRECECGVHFGGQDEIFRSLSDIDDLPFGLLWLDDSIIRSKIVSSSCASHAYVILGTDRHGLTEEHHLTGVTGAEPVSRVYASCMCNIDIRFDMQKWGRIAWLGVHQAYF
jgi:hypothetical protein